MIEKCLMIGSAHNDGENCHIARMLMDYLNEHKMDYTKLSHYQYPYVVVDIMDLNYYKKEGRRYYTAMCELELDNKTHSCRFTIEPDIVDNFFRKKKIDKIISLCQM